MQYTLDYLKECLIKNFGSDSIQIIISNFETKGLLFEHTDEGPLYHYFDGDKYPLVELIEEYTSKSVIYREFDCGLHGHMGCIYDSKQFTTLEAKALTQSYFKNKPV